MWISETYQGRNIEFEGYAETSNLAIGGVFLRSTFMLPLGFPINLEMTLDDDETLCARAVIAHRATEHEEDYPGMGVEFVTLDTDNRERLLRFFVSDRVETFYQDRFAVEFPHLLDKLTLRDIALVVNLWEDREGQISSLHLGSPQAAARKNPNLAKKSSSSLQRHRTSSSTRTPQRSNPTPARSAPNKPSSRSVATAAPSRPSKAPSAGRAKTPIKKPSKAASKARAKTKTRKGR